MNLFPITLQPPPKKSSRSASLQHINGAIDSMDDAQNSHDHQPSTSSTKSQENVKA
jgi:hypothetical protein